MRCHTAQPLHCGPVVSSHVLHTTLRGRPCLQDKFCVFSRSFLRYKIGQCTLKSRVIITRIASRVDYARSYLPHISHFAPLPTYQNVPSRLMGRVAIPFSHSKRRLLVLTDVSACVCPCFPPLSGARVSPNLPLFGYYGCQNQRKWLNRRV